MNNWWTKLKTEIIQLTIPDWTIQTKWIIRLENKGFAFSLKIRLYIILTLKNWLIAVKYTCTSGSGCKWGKHWSITHFPVPGVSTSSSRQSPRHFVFPYFFKHSTLKIFPFNMVGHNLGIGKWVVLQCK